MSPSKPPVLGLLAHRVRTLRAARGWTQEELAARSGVSLRYLVDLEKGGANISVLRLAEVAEALGVSMVTLFAGAGPVADAPEELATLTGDARTRAVQAARAPRKVALVGLRGAGKTTIGRRLADRLDVPFTEVDAAVEEAAGLHLGEIFEYHGAARYRELERQALDRLLDAPGGMVLATGGSVVTAPESWALLRRSARTVWLRASPETHLARVEAQGDFRPMHGRENALAELKSILSTREPLYAQAEVHVDTEDADVEGTVQAVLGELAAWSAL